MKPRTNLRAGASLLVLCIGLAGCRSESPGPFDLPPADEAAGARLQRWDEPRASVERSFYPGGSQLRRLREVLVLPGGAVRQHGRESAWYPDGQLEYERFFERGEPTGVWKAWYRDGAPRSEVHCDPATLGTSRWWFENGQVSSEGPAIGGAKHGQWVHYHPNGTKSAEGAYLRGRKHGEWTMWDDAGKLTARGSFEHGVRIGRWELWDAEGRPRTRGTEDAP